ncbi:MAG TPA: hypothetical protein VFX98_15070 [Longimicrobiaceae bacterium]|nr:hypothetical protein [Longimicrobiaceae bacterium]
MPAPRTGVPVAAIRSAVDEAVRARSLRSVARQVGLSPTGLRNFLNGRAPYSNTLRKLNAWYLEHELDRRVFSDPVARAALAVLLEAIPQARQPRAAARLLDSLAEVHRDEQASPPAWLEALRAG